MILLLKCVLEVMGAIYCWHVLWVYILLTCFVGVYIADMFCGCIYCWHVLLVHTLVICTILLACSVGVLLACSVGVLLTCSASLLLICSVGVYSYYISYIADMFCWCIYSLLETFFYYRHLLINYSVCWICVLSLL